MSQAKPARPEVGLGLKSDADVTSNDVRAGTVIESNDAVEAFGYVVVESQDEDVNGTTRTTFVGVQPDTQFAAPPAPEAEAENAE